MSLGLVSPLLNRGVRSRWLASLPGAGSKMLVIDSNGDTSFQDIPVAAWGSITGTLSAQTDLQSALDGKLSLTGGTLTGAVTSNLGTVTTSTPALTINQTWNNAGNTGTVYDLLSSNVSFASNPSFQNQSTYFNFNASGLGGYGTGFLRAFIKDGELSISSEWGAGTITLGAIGVRLAAVYGSGLVVSSTSGGSAIFTAGYAGRIINHMGSGGGSGGIGAGYSFASSGGAFVGDIVCEAANTIVFRNGANAQTFRLYGTYTDASNYRRLYLSSTTAGAFTLGVEGAGTGASGNTLTVPNVLYVTDKIVHRTTNYDLVRLTSSGGEGVINIGNNTSLSAANIFTSVQSNILNIQVSSNIALYANNGMTFLNSAGTARSGINAGVVDFTQPVSTSGSPTAFTLTGAAHTTLTASTEATDVNFNLARTVQFAAGALTTQRAFRIQAPTYSFASASTITTASTLSISGAPVAGTNATITNRYALNVENGVLGVGTAGSVAGQIVIQDSGQYSTNDAIRVHLGGIFLGQNISVFSVTHNGNVYVRGTLGFDGAGGGIDIHQIVWNGGWGGINRAVTTPQGAGNRFSNVYGMQVTCGANYGLMVTGSGNNNIQLYNTFTDASNYIRQSLSFTTYSSTVHAQLAAEGAGTGAVNVPFVITPRGTGAFILGPMPDGTATGGNARGANAVDLQTSRSAATQVASGTRAIAIGTSCTASAVNTIAIGRATASGGSSLAIGTDSATASGPGSIAIGFDSITASASCSVAIGASGASSTANCAIAIGSGTASRVNEVAWGFRHTAFDVRPGSFLLSATTTNNTATALQLQNIFGSSNFTTRTGVVLHGTLHVTGVKSDGSAVAIYTRRIVLKNVGGTITLVESQTIGTDYEDNALTDLTISATSPFFQVTGITGETWKWAAWFSPTCEIAY